MKESWIRIIRNAWKFIGEVLFENYKSFAYLNDSVQNAAWIHNMLNWKKKRKLSLVESYCHVWLVNLSLLQLVIKHVHFSLSKIRRANLTFKKVTALWEGTKIAPIWYIYQDYYCIMSKRMILSQSSKIGKTSGAGKNKLHFAHLTFFSTKRKSYTSKLWWYKTTNVIATYKCFIWIDILLGRKWATILMFFKLITVLIMPHLLLHQTQ